MKNSANIKGFGFIMKGPANTVLFDANLRR